MSKYKEIFDENQVLQCIELDNGNGSFTYIPIDEANSDYQAYLNPVEHLTEIPTPDEA